MATQVVSFISLDLIGNVESIDFFKVFPVTVTKRRQLVISLPLLALKASVGIL